MEFNREKYLNHIHEMLCLLANKVEAFSSLNLHNDNIHCEKFICSLLNELFNLTLIPTSQIRVNFDSIDLIDDKNKCCVQVSSDKSKKKLDDALAGDWVKNHTDYHFLFICLINNHGHHPSSCNNKHSIRFDIDTDYYDCMKIFQKIAELQDINRIKRINQLVTDELDTPNLDKIDSSLAFVVKTIYKNKIDSFHSKTEINAFEIDKKIEFNNLTSLKEKIHELAIYKEKIDNIYNELNYNGIDAAAHMFSYINDLFIVSSEKGQRDVLLFYEILDKMCEKVSSELSEGDEYNYEDIRFACLIVLVDCFISCKVFKNPEGYIYDHA